MSFYRYLETWRVRELGDESVWLFMDAADSLFRLAKSRVFTAKRVKDEIKSTPKTPKKSKMDENITEQKQEDSQKESESQGADEDPYIDQDR